MLFCIPKDRKSVPVPVKASSLTNQGWNEKALEHYLREHLATLIGEDLWIIGQSRPFQPEVDLLALDRHGDLWFFELKKIATEPDNLLQVMRYSQSASGWDINQLDSVLRQHFQNKNQQCDSLEPVMHIG